MENARALSRTLTPDAGAREAAVGTRARRRAESARHGHRPGNARHGLSAVLGPDAWARLPEAVQERFGEEAADYAGAFEIVRASRLGRVFGWLGKLVGTPVAPRTGRNVEAFVSVRPGAGGVVWLREYRWPNGHRDLVHSTKVVAPDLTLVEKLPARLCMPLHTYEENGVVHFVSRGYYFDLSFGFDPGLGDLDLGGRWRAKLWLPAFLTPGVTHVEHIDLGHGWFRFTMTVTHPLFGEMFFQTGRFCATE